MKMLTCKDASHLISQGQERPLSFRERWALKFHLWICISCRHFEQQMAMLRQALRMLGRRAASEAADSDFPPEAKERIRKVLAERIAHKD